MRVPARRILRITTIAAGVCAAAAALAGIGAITGYGLVAAVLTLAGRRPARG
jgi:hypothetical protein